MTLEGLYFIAQILSAIAVIVSLIFVGYQLRDNTREQRLRRYHENLTVQNTILDFMSDIEMSEGFLKGVFEPNSQTQAEYVQFTSMYLKAFNTYDVLRHMHEEGAISEDILRSYEGYIYSGLNTPGMDRWLTDPWVQSVLPPDTMAAIRSLKETGAERGLVSLGARGPEISQKSPENL
ncbi:MAG: hypothetical protein EP347_08435 [Alphaproteobacteria bacterium]|nr:MAG: hypothetical protein EP347_08435 [Alphaproteobacteria bacterium]